MPSGAKKRKAARRKKVNQSTNTSASSSSTLSLGGQDLKPVDEKESDGGNVSSPTSSLDYNVQQHPFSQQQDEEVEKREDTSSVRSIVAQNLQSSTVRESEAGAASAPTDSKLNPKEDFENPNATIVDWGKEVHNGTSSRSSNSNGSDNDESNVLEKKVVVVETAPPPVDSIKQVTDTVVKEPDSSVESHEEVVSMNKKVLADSCIDSNKVVESGLKENVGEKIGLQTEEDTLDTVVSTSTEYQDLPSLDVNDSESTAHVSEDRPLLSVNDSKVGASNGKEHVNNSKTTDCSIEEPLIASAPRAVQTTSWKGCCGLFELFSGSNR